MTPLANRIVREITLPLKRRSFRDDGQLLGGMSDIHCFDVSEVEPLSKQLIMSGFDWGEEKLYAAARVSSFLPAPKTWIEWREDDGRIGALLAQQAGDVAAVQFAIGGPVAFFSVPGVLTLNLGEGAVREKDHLVVSKRTLDALGDDLVSGLAIRLHSMLALINTPKIIDRVVHPPHRGLERALRGTQKASGEFPLHAWTEIKLGINRPPEAIADDPTGDSKLTGQKAFHFCRAHLRIRNGKVEFVRSHWRGDPALGIRSGRYEVTP